ncbi:MAG TPA: glycosyltransferase family 39 protein [Gemmataceae bacterium]|nr:glycosyltransferase family 39 protein [Gemmataceae bacterium]
MTLQIRHHATIANIVARIRKLTALESQLQLRLWKPERVDVIRLSIVLILALAIRTWIIAHTEVTARDSIGFMRFALNLQERPWGAVIRSYEQAPGYPMLMLAVMQPVRYFAGGMNPDSLVLCAQLTSLFASILTILPLYLLGKSLFSRDAGAIAAALWQCLPVCVQVTSDGLSEATFLFFVSWTLYFAVIALRQPSFLRFFVCGVGTGLAYWTRPEGAELLIALAGVVLVTGMLAKTIRLTTLRLTALAAGFVPFVALYVAITGHLTNKPTGRDLLNGTNGDASPASLDARRASSPLIFAAFWANDNSEKESRLLWALHNVGREIRKGLHYLGAGFALVALWWFRKQFGRDPRLWLLLGLAGLHVGILWRVAFLKGYVSDRHTMLIVLIACLWIGALIAEAGRRLTALPRLQWSGQYGATIALAAVVLGWGLPSSLKSMHANRAGHHAAGCWLAHNMSPHDEVIDPYCWAHFYSGCVFREGKELTASPGQGARYVVLEQSANQHSRLPLVPLARSLAKQGERVYFWPEQEPPDKASVVVYRVPANR